MRNTNCNNVLICIHNQTERNNIIEVLKSINSNFLDALSTSWQPRHIVEGQIYTIIFDQKAFEDNEVFLRQWYLETEDNVPLLFIGRFRPSFFCRSFIDISGLNDTKLAGLLQSVRDIINSAANTINLPVILYPEKDYEYDVYFLEY